MSMRFKILPFSVCRKAWAIAFIAACATLLLLSGCASEGVQGVAEEGTGGYAVQVVAPQDARTMMNEQQVVVVDVRTKEEFDEGHICNANLLTLDTIDEKSAAEVVPSKESTVLVYCRTGVRSAEAAQKLVDLGYTKVFDLEGGISAWPYDVCSDDHGDEGTVENDELPVGVKVVCGKTRALPDAQGE